MHGREINPRTPIVCGESVRHNHSATKSSRLGSENQQCPYSLSKSSKGFRVCRVSTSHFSDVAKIRWGSVSYLEMTPDDLNAAQNVIDKPQIRLGQWVLPSHS